MEENKEVEKVEEAKEESKYREPTVPNSILNADNGVVIMANLYIIKYLYFHVKKDTSFMEKGEGRKMRSATFYGSIVPMSRPRFARIMKGYNFRFTLADIKHICGKFGIDVKYFQREGAKLLPLVSDKGKDITEKDWRDFFWIKYESDFQSIKEGLKDFWEKKEREKNNRKGRNIHVPDAEDKEETWRKEWDERFKEGAAKVEKALKDTAQYDWDKYGKESDAIYRIYYYYSYGYRIDEDMSALFRLKDALRDLEDYTDWKKLNIEQIRAYHEALEKQTRYLEAVITMYDLLSEGKKDSQEKDSQEKDSQEKDSQEEDSQEEDSQEKGSRKKDSQGKNN